MLHAHQYKFPDDLDLLYATMKKTEELKRLDDDTCSTDRWRRQKLREEMAEAEKRELEEVSRTFMTEAPPGRLHKKAGHPRVLSLRATILSCGYTALSQGTAQTCYEHT